MYVVSYLLPVMAVIFDFQHTQTSDSIPVSLPVLLDPENMDLAVVISLLSCVEVEIRVTEFTAPPS